MFFTRNKTKHKHKSCLCPRAMPLFLERLKPGSRKPTCSLLPLFMSLPARGILPDPRTPSAPDAKSCTAFPESASQRASQRSNKEGITSRTFLDPSIPRHPTNSNKALLRSAPLVCQPTHPLHQRGVQIRARLSSVGKRQRLETKKQVQKSVSEGGVGSFGSCILPGE